MIVLFCSSREVCSRCIRVRGQTTIEGSLGRRRPGVLAPRAIGTSLVIVVDDVHLASTDAGGCVPAGRMWLCILRMGAHTVMHSACGRPRVVPMRAATQFARGPRQPFCFV